MDNKRAVLISRIQIGGVEMEEDIKVLEELKNIFVHLKNYGWVNDIKRDVVADKVIQALENLIARNKELEEIKERYLRLESDKFWDNVISKSKVREKIEELEKKNKLEDWVNYTGIIGILEELLQEKE